MNQTYDETRRVKRWIHQPLTVDHYGTNISIKENGYVTLSRPVAGSDDIIEVDEIDVPASLIFKVAMLLKATRKPEYFDSVVEDKK